MLTTLRALTGAAVAVLAVTVDDGPPSVDAVAPRHAALRARRLLHAAGGDRVLRADLAAGDGRSASLIAADPPSGAFGPAERLVFRTFVAWAEPLVRELVGGARPDRRDGGAGLDVAAASPQAAVGRTAAEIADRAAALLGARAAVVGLLDDDEVVVYGSAAHAGEPGARIALAGTLAEEVLTRRRPISRSGASAATTELGTDAVAGVLMVPLIGLPDGEGVLAVFEAGNGAKAFGADDARRLMGFAAGAALALGTAASLAEESLRAGVRAAEGERRRWARELHDGTLQSLSALRTVLDVALHDAPDDRLGPTIVSVRQMLESDIAEVRELIANLRPSVIDDLGLVAGLDGLVRAFARSSGVETDARIELDDGRPPLHADVEVVVYRLAQEALQNVAKHAGARSVQVVVVREGPFVHLTVRDDGVGFDPDAAEGGFGLDGMRERVALVLGTLDISSRPGLGTTVRATVPASP